MRGGWPYFRMRCWAHSLHGRESENRGLGEILECNWSKLDPAMVIWRSAGPEHGWRLRFWPFPAPLPTRASERVKDRAVAGQPEVSHYPATSRCCRGRTAVGSRLHLLAGVVEARDPQWSVVLDQHEGLRRFVVWAVALWLVSVTTAEMTMIATSGRTNRSDSGGADCASSSTRIIRKPVGGTVRGCSRVLTAVDGRNHDQRSREATALYLVLRLQIMTFWLWPVRVAGSGLEEATPVTALASPPEVMLPRPTPDQAVHHGHRIRRPPSQRGLGRQHRAETALPSTRSAAEAEVPMQRREAFRGPMGLAL